MDTLAAAKAAIQNLSPSQAPTAAPVSTALPSNITPQGTMVPQGTGAPTQLSAVTPELQQLFAAQQKVAPAALASQQMAGNAATAVSNAYNSQLNNYYSSIQAANAKSQAAANYQQVKAPDGGYNFYDDKGQPITAWKYAAALGKDVTQVLAGSNNPVDQQYINDHKTLDTLMSAWQSGNKTDMTKVATQLGYTDASALSKALQKAGVSTPADLNTAFMNAYPNIWGQGNGAAVGDMRQHPAFGVNQPSTFFGG